ncbi:hypothetical protein PM082_002290 [Marasmius tenuissimus]|nr:hypothetical protein PM082_002290 [Marasmius tenuissimus]
MPPKLNSANLGEYFRFNSTQTKVYCTLCSPAEIGLARNEFLPNNRNQHLTTISHWNALKALEEAKAKQEARQRARERERQRQRNVTSAALRDTSIRPKESRHPFHSLQANSVASSSSTTITSVPECFWDSANYYLGPDLGRASVEEHKQLEKELETATLWHDDHFGGVVGLDEKRDSEEAEKQYLEEQDEQLLAEMMSSAAVDDHALNELLYGLASLPIDGTWSPYESKVMCILDILDNIPRA